jgi:hypothetical protein
MTRAKSKDSEPEPASQAEAKTETVTVPNVGPDATSGGGEPLEGSGFEKIETTQESD